MSKKDDWIPVVVVVTPPDAVAGKRHLVQRYVDSRLPITGEQANDDLVAVRMGRYNQIGESYQNLRTRGYAFEVFRPTSGESKSRHTGGHQMADPEHARDVQMALSGGGERYPV